MYYPQSEIIPNQHTTTGMVYKDTKQPYTGYYYATSDGKYYEGANFTPTAKELIMSTDRALSNVVTAPIEHTPVPTAEDYSKGYITRYFTIRVNSGFETIREVSKDTYTTTLSNPLYSQAIINWKISGKMMDDDSNPAYTIPGVISLNKKAIMEQEHLIPGINNFLINPIQYHK